MLPSQNYTPTPEEQQAASNVFLQTIMEQRDVAMNRCAELFAQVTILNLRIEGMDKTNSELAAKIAELTAPKDGVAVFGNDAIAKE